MTGTAAAASLARLARADAGEDAAFWAKVRAEFMVTDEVAYMNNGTLGPCPKPVFYTVVERYRELAADPGGRNKPQEDAAEEVRKRRRGLRGRASPTRSPSPATPPRA